jgi:hypothetical protein
VITVRLTGGLGNQLFQYAAARSLALKHNTCVRVDTTAYGSWFSSPLERNRSFELTQLSLADPVVPTGAALAALQVKRTAASALRLTGLYASPRYFYETLWHFNPAVLALPDGAYLKGFFQSEKYFADIKDEIRREFRPRDPQAAIRVAERMRGLRRDRPLVSLHIRRGDYLRFKRGEMLEPLERIRQTMALFSDSDFLVFSDDLDWCRENLAGPEVLFSPFNTALDNLLAMTMCDHNIIAGSSFGWWGAWLNPNPRKRVVARATWFTAWPDRPDINRDIHAEGWEKF